MIVLENAAPRLRGRMTNLMLEVRAGVYVGDFGAKVREDVWEDIVRMTDNDASVVMAWTAPTESGFDLRTHGQNRRIPVDVDGFKLVSFITERT